MSYTPFLTLRLPASGSSLKTGISPARDGNWAGAGRATLGTDRVNTSAGDCTDGVSSAGGVKSISSSKLSSNSCKIQLSKQADLCLKLAPIH